MLVLCGGRRKVQNNIQFSILILIATREFLRNETLKCPQTVFLLAAKI